ncbi:outer membrane beta-barrel protein [Mitsuaria sp. WAJ17]|uniref:outer membrane beta-barrel protein n=1 Tax=Mitsuaria sp. WAJ17 TaxID=2761452 RepID=UPI00160001ED|nr:outer membrane beta-barrel protein [Mitsuaria sp. WAJ17]MBB2485340.1 outer membrane beta-barrel protein [Mitsuaria sp. WAJ17]
MTTEKDLKMHVRHHGHPCAAPARPATGRTGLCLILGTCVLAATAHAQAGASSTSGSSATEPSLAAQDQHGTGGSYASAGGSYAGSDYSWIPYTRRGYMGISLGKSDYATPCGQAPLSCENRDRAFALYTGGMFNDFLGLELGLRHYGKVDRAGGEARAYGANLSLVGMVDMENINVYAKAGVIYGHTKISADPLSGVSTGTKNGWGPSATIGVGFNFNRNFTVAIERNRDRFKLPGGASSYVQSTAVALKYRF